MNTLWRIVLLFFLSKQVLTYRNEYFLIVSLIFKTSFVKNSISMKTWTLLLFMHVIPNTIRCISLRFDSFQILRIEKNRNLYKFCATSPPPSHHIYLYPSWQQAPTDQLGTGRIAAEGVVPLRASKVFARFKFVRAEMEAFKGIRSKTLSSYFIRCANNPLFPSFLFFLQIQDFITQIGYKIIQLFRIR